MDLGNIVFSYISFFMFPFSSFLCFVFPVDLRLTYVYVVLGTTCNIYVVVFLGWQAAYRSGYGLREVRASQFPSLKSGFLSYCVGYSIR